MTNPNEVVLDWRPNPAHWVDSQRFRFTSIPACAVTGFRDNILRRKNIWLDQGREGACTGFGEESVQALSPYPKVTTNEQARAVYYEARRQDEWPGEDYEGSSVNGAMRAARLLGRVKAWYWARTLGEALHGVSYHGAGELGVNWYTGMFDPDENGFIHVTGDVEGGHALAYAGYKYINGKRAHRLENSWGPDWGQNGGCWISEPEFTSLLDQDGELAFPSKVRI